MGTHDGVRRPGRSLLARSALAVLLVLPLLGLAASPAAAAPSLSWTRRAAGLAQPTQVTSARDGTGRLFVVEKAGRVRVFVHGALLARPFLDIRSLVKDDGEGGLLSIAFHPDYRAHPFVWAAYTDNAGDVRVSRFRATGFRADTTRAGTAKTVLTVAHPDRYTNHFGGQLVFGPGRLLFMSTGDGGGTGDPLRHGQSRTTLQGKILRIQVVGAKKACGRYRCFPRSNPYAGSTPGRAAIWAIGLRNAWRFSVDPATGALWIGDVGQDAVEEVDRVGTGGLNLGWSCREGDRAYAPSRCAPGTRFHQPSFTYDHSYGHSITGGFIYRGSRYAALLGGHYVGGDYGSGKVFVSSAGRLVTAGSLPGVTSFGEDAARELWAVTIDGGLWQMSAA